MNKLGEVLSVEIPVYVDAVLGMSDEGDLRVAAFVSTGSEDNLTEIETSFDDMIDNLIDYYQYENKSKTLLRIARELHRYAEALETVAAHMNEEDLHWSQEPDDFMTTSDLYDQLDK